MERRNKFSRRAFIRTGLIFVPASASAHIVIVPGPLARLSAVSASAEPELSNWVSRVQGRGSDVTGSGVQTAVGDFIIACKNAGIWTKLKRVGVYAGDALAALEAPLLNTWGSTTDTMTNFDAGDYTEATGLSGNGTDEYINTGINLSTNGASIDDIHASVYMRTYTAESFAYGLGGRGSGGTNLFAVRPRNDDTSNWYCTSTGHSASDTDGLGLYTGSRISASSSTLYRRTTSLVTADPASTDLPNTTLFVHAFSNDGTASSLTTRKISFYSIGLGLSSTNVTDLYNAVQELQTDLGRQV